MLISVILIILTESPFYRKINVREINIRVCNAIFNAFWGAKLHRHFLNQKKFKTEKGRTLKCFFFYECNLVLYIFLGHASCTVAEPVFTCSKLKIETLEQGVKYAQS